MAPMRDQGETTVFHIRGTDPANSEQVVYACVGFPMAHAKAAELRMSGYKDVVTSMAPAGEPDRVANDLSFALNAPPQRPRRERRKRPAAARRADRRASSSRLAPR